MFAAKLFTFAFLLMGANARRLPVYEVFDPETSSYLLLVDDLAVAEDEGLMEPVRASRERRQVQGSMAFNSDGTSGANLKVPLAGNDRNVLSAIGAAGFSPDQKLSSATAGLALDNVNGHGLTLTNTHLPGVGDRMAAGGRFNVFHNNDHNLDANAFAARTVLNNPAAPKFNTYGGGVDYMFKNKVGAEFNVARTPLFDKTDYSAMGKLNVFRNRDSSLDFNAGLSKSVSPFIPSRSWEPTSGFTFRKFF